MIAPPHGPEDLERQDAAGRGKRTLRERSHCRGEPFGLMAGSPPRSFGGRPSVGDLPVRATCSTPPGGGWLCRRFLWGRPRFLFCRAAPGGGLPPDGSAAPHWPQWGSRCRPIESRVPRRSDLCCQSLQLHRWARVDGALPGHPPSWPRTSCGATLGGLVAQRLGVRLSSDPMSGAGMDAAPWLRRRGKGCSGVLPGRHLHAKGRPVRLLSGRIPEFRPRRALPSTLATIRGTRSLLRSDQCFPAARLSASKLASR